MTIFQPGWAATPNPVALAHRSTTWTNREKFAMTVRRRLIQFVLGWLVFTAALVAVSDSASAQINRELRSVFEGMMDDLPDDLRAKFARALAENDPTIEFTLDEFRRFQRHPANPFEEIEDIDPEEGETTIELRFELPSLRDRPVGPLEREHPGLLAGLDRATRRAAASTVRFVSGTTDLALGAIVREDGMAVTKASEIEAADPLMCLIPGRGKVLARILKIDQDNDVALVQLDAHGLRAIEWASRQPLPGSFLLTPNERNEVVSLGTYSAVGRSLRQGRRAFLGVGPRTVEVGVQIDVIEPGSAAQRAGLQVGDIITRLADVPMNDVTSLVNTIRQHQPGDAVAIEFLRAGEKQQTRAVLAGQHVSGARAARFKMMARLGAIPNRRADGFSFAFQHDSPLLPEQCGGPITDLQGNVVGLNIARNNRAASYAIPSSHVQTIVDELLRSAVASRPDTRPQ